MREFADEAEDEISSVRREVELLRRELAVLREEVGLERGFRSAGRGCDEGAAAGPQAAGDRSKVAR